MRKGDILDRDGRGAAKNGGPTVSALLNLMKNDRSSEERRVLSSVCDTIQQIIYVTDPDTCEVLYANRFFRERLGTDPVGSSCYHELRHLKQPCDFCADVRLKKERRPHMVEVYLPVLKAHLLAVDQVLRLSDGRDLRFHLALDITDRIEAETRATKIRDALETRLAKNARELETVKDELALKSRKLEETATALKVLLNRSAKERAELEKRLLINAKDRILPYLDLLKESGLSEEQRAYVALMRLNLAHIVAPAEIAPSEKYLSLTPMEIRVANMVKLGKSTKEIALALNLSHKTAEYHRNSIRDKLGLKNRKVNLRAHLASCPWA